MILILLKEEKKRETMRKPKPPVLESEENIDNYNKALKAYNYHKDVNRISKGLKPKHAEEYKTKQTLTN